MEYDLETMFKRSSIDRQIMELQEELSIALSNRDKKWKLRVLDRIEDLRQQRAELYKKVG